MLFRDELSGFEHDGAQFLRRHGLFALAGLGVKAQHLKDGADEEIDEPDRRVKQACQRHQDETDAWAEPVWISGADHLGCHFRKHQQAEGND